MKFQIGDRVICIRSYERVKIGYRGTICIISGGEPSIGVYWDTDIGGHSCRGRCEDGHGYFVCEHNIDFCDDFEEEALDLTLDEDLI